MAASKDTTGNSGHDEASPLGEAMSDAIDGMASSIGDPAEWPEMAEEFARNSYKDLMAEGWWPAIYAAGGSLATLIGAVLVARRRSRHSGLMAAAMPMMAAAKPMMAAMESQLVDASEQMMRNRTKSSSGWMRTVVTLGLFAATGWGIRRAMAQAN